MSRCWRLLLILSLDSLSLALFPLPLWDFVGHALRRPCLLVFIGGQKPGPWLLLMLLRLALEDPASSSGLLCTVF